MQLVVAIEAAGERRAADQREEGEAAADRPRFPLLVVLCVAAPCEQVDEEDDEGEDEPGGGHRADDAQGLQVQLRVRLEVLVLESVEGDVDVGHLVQEYGPQGGVVLLLLVRST